MLARQISRPTFASTALGAGLLAAVAGLTGCVGIGTLFDLAVPAPVAGVAGAGWAGLPLRAWLSREGIRAEAMTGCFTQTCDPRLAVGLFTATGDEAQRLAAVLDEPARLHAMIGSWTGKRPPGRGAAGPLRLTADRIGTGALRGFLARIGRADGSRSVAMAALGTRGVEPLRLVLVVGDDPASVERVAREVAAANFPRIGPGR